MANEEQQQSEQEEILNAEAQATEQEPAAESPDEGEHGPAEDSVESLKAQLEEAQQQVADAKDQAIRAVAESQNTRRRAEKDVESAHKFALEKFAGELLVVADNMERALSAADIEHEAVKPLAEGVELTQKSLIGALAKFKIEQLDPVGEPFDPQFHQAMSMVENPDVEPNTVTLVMQKGYTLNGRLLRPAMVMVSKAAAGQVDEKA